MRRLPTHFRSPKDQALLSRVCEAAMPQTQKPQHLWRGHRTFHIDGSSFSMPDTAELRRAFGQPTGQQIGCGFPTAHLLVLFSAATGFVIDAFASPLRTGDVSQASEYLAHLDAGDILIGDDSFSGYAHFALLLQANLHGLFPNHHRRIIDFTPGRMHTKVSGKDEENGRRKRDSSEFPWTKKTGRRKRDEENGTKKTGQL